MHGGGSTPAAILVLPHLLVSPSGHTFFLHRRATVGLWSHLPIPQALYLTLLEVALAIKHLHGMHLVHCDIKAANVLLKSNTLDPRWVVGWVVERLGGWQLGGWLSITLDPRYVGGGW